MFIMFLPPSWRATWEYYFLERLDSSGWSKTLQWIATNIFTYLLNSIRGWDRAARKSSFKRVQVYEIQIYNAEIRFLNVVFKANFFYFVFSHSSNEKRVKGKISYMLSPYFILTAPLSIVLSAILKCFLQKLQ